jgi:CRP-like cAMP-binding protein
LPRCKSMRVQFYTTCSSPDMLSIIERVLLLREAEIFKAISSEDLVPVARVAREITIPAGATFIREGEIGDCLYVILSGEASVVVPGAGQVATRGPRSVIGEMAVISGQPRSADCVATTEITAIRVDRDEFWELLSERPPLALGVIAILTQRLDEAVKTMSTLRPI